MPRKIGSGHSIKLENYRNSFHVLVCSLYLLIIRSMNIMKHTVRISGKLNSQIFTVSIINCALLVKWNWVYINYHPDSNAAAYQNFLSSSLLVVFYLNCLPKNILQIIPRLTMYDWNRRHIQDSSGYDWFIENRIFFIHLKW